MYDSIIVGSGIAGSTAARRLAEEGKRNVLVIEKRSHIGGNCYDCMDEHGIWIHQYGPHIFHTEMKEVYEFFSRFTMWTSFRHEVVAQVGEQLIPVPFNLNTLPVVFEKDKAEELEKKLTDTYGYGSKVPIMELRKSEDAGIREIADYVYQNIFLYYTMKQWGQKPEEISPEVTGRVPVLISYDNRYFQDKYQAIPAEGYTKMAERMLDNPLIRTELNTDFNDVRGSTDYERLFYTGPIDEFFDFELGELPYRSLDIVFRRHDRAFYQSGPQINYPENYDFTRSVEYKYYLDEQTAQTIVSEEYPQAYEAGRNERYYPVPDAKNHELYRRYRRKADGLEKVYFAGRLGDYKYYNMDEAVKRALELFEEIR